MLDTFQACFVCMHQIFINGLGDLVKGHQNR